MPDIRVLADQAAEKIRGGYIAPHAINSVLKDAAISSEEKEILRSAIARELNRRSQARKKKKKRKEKERAEEENKQTLREARRAGYERRDHLLPDQ